MNDKQSATLSNDTQHSEHNPDFITIPTTQTTLAGSNISDTITIQLNAEQNDDLRIIHTFSSDENENACEPLLFKNGYFKVISQKDMVTDTMCMICGLDENNKPKKVLKAQKNVSSNLISHFKVNVKL